MTNTDLPAALWPVTTRRIGLGMDAPPGSSAAAGELARLVDQFERPELARRGFGEAGIGEALGRDLAVDDALLLEEGLHAEQARHAEGAVRIARLPLHLVEHVAVA